MNVAYRITFVFVLILGLAVSAFGESLVATSPGTFVPAVQTESGILLWDNTNINTVTSGIVSSDLRGRNPDSSLVQTADDFVVPAGVKWLVDSLWVRGFSTVPGLPDSFGVAIHGNDAGKPGTLVHWESVIPANGIRFDSLRLKLGAPVSLTTGTYWLSVYAIYNAGTVLSQTRWNWYTGSIANGLQGHIQDFTGLFGIPPFPWTPLSALGVTQPSTHFAIYGTSVTPVDALVILQDSTTGTATNIACKKADRDTLFAHLPSFIGNYDVAYIDSNGTALPALGAYSTIIYLETSFDVAVSRFMGVAPRQALKTWLNGGAPEGILRSLVMIGGDLGYNYSRSGSTGRDLEFAQQLLQFIYRVDDGNIAGQNAITGQGAFSGTELAITTTPPSTGFWPDGCSRDTAGVALFSYKGRGAADTLASIGRTTAGFKSACLFNDPRYFTGAGGGFRKALESMLTYVGIVSSVEPIDGEIPQEFTLLQNYPNPFNPTTNIQYALPHAAAVTLKIFNVLGQEVATLVDAVQEAGGFEATWNGRTSNGLTVSSGVYFYQLTVKGSGTTETFSSMKKMVLMK